MNQHTIHETIIRDIFDTIQDVKNSDEVDRVKNFRQQKSIKSITSKAEALTMVFPVICSRNMSYTSAAMICKAIERKAVTLLQMLFSAANITDAENGIDYISNFHSNLNKRMSVDDFMRVMDTFVEENGLLETDTAEYKYYKSLQEDMKAMNFYFEKENINEASLDMYKVVNVGNTQDIIDESQSIFEDSRDNEIARLKDKLARASQIATDNLNRARAAEAENKASRQNLVNAYNQGMHDMSNQISINKQEFEKEREETRKKEREEDILHRNKLERDNKRHQGFQDKMAIDRLGIERRRADIEADKVEWQNIKTAEDIARLRAEIVKDRLVNNDIKKVNELVPTLMYVNFVSKGDANSKYPISTSMVVGVKAKLYAVDGDDIMNRLKIKHNDRHLMLNLVKVSTREISFFRDFLFCIDKAKIDALSQSRRGSSNKVWKILERRAMRSKFRMLFNMKNDATAITTLCITQDEAEYLRKTQYVDVENPGVIRPIMDAYNMMGFVIADEALEICKFKFDDDDDEYEVLTYDNLEREQKDNTKKILNLMAKM